MMHGMLPRRLLTWCMLMSFGLSPLVLHLGAVGGFSFVGFAAAQSSRSGMYVYPRDGQTANQQGTDDWQCHNSAVEVTGYDPTNPPSYAPYQPDRTEQSKTLAKGAVIGSATSSAIGAAAGAAVGEAARGAAAGAAGGGVAGLIHGLFAVFSHQGRHQQQQQQYQQQRRHDYQRAFSACMDARGYSVG